MNRKKIVATAAALVLVAVAAVALYLRGHQRTTDLTQVSLRLPIPAADTAFAPYYLAVDKGIFAKHGLSVHLEPGTPELNPVKMVAQGTNNFGVVGGPELLLSGRAKGAPLVGIAQIHKNSDFVVIATLRDSGITKLSDLEGKKVGFFYGHISTDILRMLFRKENIHVQEVDVGFDYGQLLAKKIDAQWAFRTTAGLSLPERGVQLTYISPADFGIVTQGHMVITNDLMISEKAEIVQRFVDAVTEAVAYSADHVNESIEATMKRDPAFKRTVGEKQMEIYRNAILRNSPIGWISKADMDQTKAQMEAVGLIPSDFKADSAYTDQFLKNYYDRKH